MYAQDFSANGFVLIPDILSESECKTIVSHYKLTSKKTAGSRNLLSHHWCISLAQRLKNTPLLSGLMGSNFAAVQCTYFEKSIDRNWIVPVHQDLSIPALEKIIHPTLKGWSEKEGELYVQAPQGVLENLIAVRLHLDNCNFEDGALRVFKSSHELGPIDSAIFAEEKNNFSEVICTASAGSGLVMRPLLLHASSKATGNSLRRVLHFLFAPPTLPLGLRWLYQI